MDMNKYIRINAKLKAMMARDGKAPAAVTNDKGQAYTETRINSGLIRRRKL